MQLGIISKVPDARYISVERELPILPCSFSASSAASNCSPSMLSKYRINQSFKLNSNPLLDFQYRNRRDVACDRLIGLNESHYLFRITMLSLRAIKYVSVL